MRHVVQKKMPTFSDLKVGYFRHDGRADNIAPKVLRKIRFWAAELLGVSVFATGSKLPPGNGRTADSSPVMKYRVVAAMIPPESLSIEREAQH